MDIRIVLIVCKIIVARCQSEDLLSEVHVAQSHVARNTDTCGSSLQPCLHVTFAIENRVMDGGTVWLDYSTGNQVYNEPCVETTRSSAPNLTAVTKSFSIRRSSNNNGRPVIQCERSHHIFLYISDRNSSEHRWLTIAGVRLTNMIIYPRNVSRVRLEDCHLDHMHIDTGPPTWLGTTASETHTLRYSYHIDTNIDFFTKDNQHITNVNVECPPNQHLVESDLTHDPRQFNYSTRLQCRNCPDGRYVINNENMGLVSRDGAWKVTNSRARCLWCPFLGRCNNGHIIPIRGYWGYTEDGSVSVGFRSCPVSEYCCSTADGTCITYNSCGKDRPSQDYFHNTCSRCNDGYMESYFSTICIEESRCHPAMHLIWVASALVYVIVFLVMSDISRKLKRSVGKGGKLIIGLICVRAVTAADEVETNAVAMATYDDNPDKRASKRVSKPDLDKVTLTEADDVAEKRDTEISVQKEFEELEEETEKPYLSQMMHFSVCVFFYQTMPLLIVHTPYYIEESGTNWIENILTYQDITIRSINHLCAPSIPKHVIPLLKALLMYVFLIVFLVVCLIGRRLKPLSERLDTFHTKLLTALLTISTFIYGTFAARIFRDYKQTLGTQGVCMASGDFLTVLAPVFLLFYVVLFPFTFAVGIRKLQAGTTSLRGFFLLLVFPIVGLCRMKLREAAPPSSRAEIIASKFTHQIKATGANMARWLLFLQLRKLLVAMFTVLSSDILRSAVNCIFLLICLILPLKAKGIFRHTRSNWTHHYSLVVLLLVSLINMGKSLLVYTEVPVSLTTQNAMKYLVLLESIMNKSLIVLILLVELGPLIHKGLRNLKCCKKRS